MNGLAQKDLSDAIDTHTCLDMQQRLLQLKEKIDEDLCVEGFAQFTRISSSYTPALGIHLLEESHTVRDLALND